MLQWWWGCCRGGGWERSPRRFSKLNHYWVEPWLSLATGTADYKASKKISTWTFDSKVLHWWCQRALSHTQSRGRAGEGVKKSYSHHIPSESFLWPHCHSPVCLVPGLALGTGTSGKQCSRQGADGLQCGQRLWRAGCSDCGLTTFNSDGVQWLSLCIW